MIPRQPSFSQACVAHLLGRGRSTISYWIDAGKLWTYRDAIGERYILREELVTFVETYLNAVVATEEGMQPTDIAMQK